MLGVVAIFGPTASGKSEIAAHVAGALRTEVVSADAMQVYRGLPILTNRSPHPERLTGIVELEEEMSVGRYAPLAHEAIDELVAACGSVVVTGGTGLYLRAALAELEPPPPPAPGLRARLEAFYDADPAASYAALEQRDPAAAAGVHVNDRRRVVRALELAEQGRSLRPADSRLWHGTTRHPTVTVGLDLPMPELERRIRERTAEMFRRGVVAEVESIRSRELSATARKVLGIAEIMGLTAPEAEERIAVSTRRYAAYQRKWMRSIRDVVMIDASGPPRSIAAEIVALVRR